MNADDVVASFRQYLDQKTSQILSALPATMIEPSGVVKTGPYTVQFLLKAPNNALPVPRQPDHVPGDHPAGSHCRKARLLGLERHDRHGPVPPEESEQATRGARALRPVLGRQPAAGPGRDHVLCRPAPMVLALRGGQLDVVVQMSPQQARAFRNNSRYRVYTVPVSSHNMFGLRVDTDPFKDARVRRAVALTLNRPDIINRVLLGAGHDRKRLAVLHRVPVDVPRSRSASRTSRGPERCSRPPGRRTSKFTITTHNQYEVPDYAARSRRPPGRQGSHRPRRDDLRRLLRAVRRRRLCDDTPWLNTPTTITEYGARGHRTSTSRPPQDERHLERVEVREQSVRPAARSYLGAADLKAQRKHARRWQTLLLPDTPVITAYFLAFTAPGSKKVQGLRGRSDLAHPCRQDLARLEERIGRPEPDSGRPRIREHDGPLHRASASASRVVTLVLLSILVFSAAQLLPGDLGRSVLGRTLRPGGGRRVQPRARHRSLRRRAVPRLGERRRARRPRQLTRASEQPGRDVLEPALLNSLKLAVFAFVLVVPFGILGGVLSGLRVGKATDRGDHGRRTLRSRSCRSSSPGSCSSWCSRSGRLAARHRAVGTRQRAAHSGPASDPPGDPAHVRPVRLHRAHGACGRRSRPWTPTTRERRL